MRRSLDCKLVVLALRSALLGGLVLALAATSAFATGATIGLYRDSNGYSCSFSGDNTGIITAYVVIQPGSSGIRAVRFSAPIPPCFKATFVGESAPDVFAVIGSSQTGISISSRNCETQPFYALEIQYMNNGGTTPCCEFPILADPLTGMLEAVDCSYNSTPINSMVSHFNATESCPCGDIYQAPLAPSNPYPANYAASVELDPVLAWTTPADPGGLGLSYDLYFGSELSPPLVASDVMVTGPTSHGVGHLAENAIYYWRVVLRNFAGKETTGPLWVFTTKTALPPTVMNVSPANGSIAPPSPTLTWSASDPEGGPLQFDVYLGNGSPPPLAATHVTSMSYSPGLLIYGVSYFWRIVAHDSEGTETSGPTWSFTTGADPPPSVTNLSPVCGSTQVNVMPTLTWQATESYGQSMKYDVYFGTGPTPPLVASDLAVKSYTPGVLSYSTAYTWRVMARDSGGQQTLSTLCDFTTTSDPPPTVTNLAPACGSTGVPLTQTLTWAANDPFGQSMTYDVYLGTSLPLPRLATGLSAKSYAPANLFYSVTYFWQVVAHDSGGQQASSELCSFTTKSQNDSPFIPSNPSPADNATNVSTATTFSWQCLDPEGEELKFDVYLGKIPAPPSNTTIGVYSDAVGSTCSLSSNPSGLTTLYVVVKPHGSGVTGVRFSSVAPGCFGAVYLYDTVPSPLVSIGSSQTGISISSPTCQSLPFVALQMGFMASASTTPCCEFAVAPDPFTGILEAIDCAYANAPIATVVSYINSNTTCRCDSQMRQIAFSIKQKSTFFGSMEPASYYQWQVIARDPGLHQTTGPLWTFQTKPNQPPSTPSSPSPANGAVNVVSNATLSWQCSDPESQQLKYDVYFGTSNPPPLVKTNATSNAYNPGTLSWVTTYWWRIVARDTYGATTSGTTWSFTTKPANLPPNAPALVSPANAGTNLPVNTTLAWSGSDPEAQALKYDVYFGSETVPPMVAHNATATEYVPLTLAVSTTYRWRIVVRDTGGLETSGPTWSFQTSSSANQAPVAAGNPSPPDGTSTEKTSLLLEWYNYDPDNDPLTYTVIGMNDQGYVFSGQTSARQFAVGPLEKYMTYYWNVATYDGHWYVQSPTWSFYISGGGIAVLVSRFDATPQRDRVSVKWELSSDEEMDRFTLLRHDGAANAPPRTVAEGPAAVKGSFVDTGVEPGKTYHYEIVVRATSGSEFRSPVATADMPDLQLTLYQNQPNPFNPQTTIRYDLPGGTTRVRLLIVDASGRRVRKLVDETQSGGARSVVWNGRDDNGGAVASGVYFYVLDAGKDRLTRKLVLLK